MSLDDRLRSPFAPWILAGLALLIFSAGYGLRDPWPADEPRFALVAQEMVESGQWFFPRRAGELYSDKPPLFFWALAAGYAATGSVRWSFLLPSLLAGLGTLFLVYDLARRLWNRRVALFAGWTLLLVTQFPLQVRTAQIDASVAFFITLGLYGVVRHLVLGPSWKWWWIGGFAMGLGIITKGVGFLPLLALVPWILGRRLGKTSLPRIGGPAWRWAVGPLLLLGAVSLWALPMLWLVSQSGDPDLVSYRDDILVGQTAERYTSYAGHQNPAWYYPVEVIPSLWLPVVLFVPWLIPAWWRRLRRGDGRYLVLLGWIVAVVVFFSFSSGKRGVYILPAVPAFALCCAPLLAAGLDRRKGPRHVVLGFLALFSALFFALAPAVYQGRIEAVNGLGKDAQLAALCVTAGLLGLASLGVGRVLRTDRTLPSLTLFFAGLWLIHGWWAFGIFDGDRSESLLMEAVEARLAPPDTDLALVGWREQTVLQARRPVVHWGYWPENDRSEPALRQMEQAAAWLAEGGDRAALVPEDWMWPCFVEGAGVALGEWHRLELRLVDADALTGACGPPREPLRAYRVDFGPARR